MSVATWADIQRLAADFQRIQLTEESKKLSEKNCVEIISMLIASKEIDVVFTIDGQEYITRKHLLTEIKNECIGQGGRVSLSDLARVIGVGYEHIENAISTIVKQSSSFMHYGSEIFSIDYLDDLCNDVNERLAENGVISVSQLVKSWGLSTEFLNEMVLINVGTKINAVRDGDMLYTATYLTAQKSALRAILSALTTVTPVSKMLTQLSITPSTFWMLFDEIDSAKEVPGSFVGGRASSHALYYPHIYMNLVKRYVLKTFKENKLFELNVLRKLSISDPQAFMKDLLENKNDPSEIYFPSAVVDGSLLEEIEAEIQEEMNAKLYVDVVNHLPEILQKDADTELLINKLMKQNKNWLHVAGKSLVYNNILLTTAFSALDSFLTVKADELFAVWKQQRGLKKDEKMNTKESDEWAFGRSKKGKGKGKGAKHSAAAEAKSDMTAKLTEADLCKELEGMGDYPLEILEDLAEQIRPKAELQLLSRMESLMHSVQAISAQDQKRTHARLQEKLQTLYENICIFEEGANHFDAQVSGKLRIHLLRTLCTDFAQTVLSYITQVDNPNILSLKIRDEVIKNIENTESRAAVEKLFASLSSKELGAFHDAVFDASSSSVCSLNLKMPDKKERIELVKKYKNELEQQLRDIMDAAVGLLLSLLILIAREENIAVHASGKFVSHLIAKVESYQDSTEELSELLTSAQKMVINYMQRKDDRIKEKLDEKLLALKANINGFEYIDSSETML